MEEGDATVAHTCLRVKRWRKGRNRVAFPAAALRTCEQIL